MSTTTESTQMVSDVLAAGRKHIERGWCKGSYGSGQSVCIYGALNKVETGKARVSEDHQYSPATITAIRTLADLVPEFGHRFIATFNDAEKTTRQDVLDLFDKAIAQADEKCL